MAYPAVVRQEGFQLPSPLSVDDDAMPPPFVPKLGAVDFADELATLIVPSHQRSAHPADPALFDIAPHPDAVFDNAYFSAAPEHRSRSRSGPARSARRDRRAHSISSHASPPPRQHPHPIVIPGRQHPMGGFFVPNATSAPPDYPIPATDSLGIYPYPAQPAYYPYRTGTPGLGISPNDVETLNSISMNGIQHLASSLPVSKPAPPLDPDAHLSEKRRRRRESHNAVERRRRDNINERIGELAGLIPGVLFECDGPLVVPGTSSAAGPNLPDDVLTLGVLADPDGLPEEGSLVKKDPAEEGESLTPMSPASGIPVSANEQSTIKANKGMILRKSVEYIRYLQQLVSVQASRGRDLEERNRALERELAVFRGDPLSSASPASSSSPSLASSAILSLSSSSSKPSSVDMNGVQCAMEIEDEDRSRERDESRGRRLGRARMLHQV